MGRFCFFFNVFCVNVGIYDSDFFFCMFGGVNIDGEGVGYKYGEMVVVYKLLFDFLGKLGFWLFWECWFIVF